MPDLRSALFGAGVASERQFREATAAEQLDQEAAAAKARKSGNERERRMEILSSTTSPDLFRREARKLLLQDPELVQQIITIAHAQNMPKRHKQGGGRLIASLLSLRQQLSINTLSNHERIAIVDKNFTKH
jgi:hypothetical protein